MKQIRQALRWSFIEIARRSWIQEKCSVEPPHRMAQKIELNFEQNDSENSIDRASV